MRWVWRFLRAEKSTLGKNGHSMPIRFGATQCNRVRARPCETGVNRFDSLQYRGELSFTQPIRRINSALLVSSPLQMNLQPLRKAQVKEENANC